MKLEQYKRAIEQSNIVSKTNLDGVITFVNDEFCKVSGYSREELIGANHNIIRHPDVSKETFQSLWDTIKAKKTYISTVKNRAKDGTTFYVNTTVIPMLNENGNIEEFIAIRYNVTRSIALTERLKQKEEELEQLNATLEERVKKQTKELRKLNKTLERRIKKEVEKNRDKDRVLFQQSRLAAMGEMIGNIAHQWRQPLSSISTMASGAKIRKKAGLIEDSELIETFDKITAHTKYLSRTIDDFRNFFKKSTNKTVFSVQEVVRQAITLTDAIYKNNQIIVSVDINDSNLKCEGNESELSQVFMNVLNNSKDALIENEIENKHVFINISNLNNDIIIQIYDNAGGISEDIIEKIFEPYFTTKHRAQGTGIGLFMCKEIIEKHFNGTISVSNKEFLIDKNGYQGAQFNIKIPHCNE